MTYGYPGHCFSIDGEWWHEPGQCKNPECQTRPCCRAEDPAFPDPIPRGEQHDADCYCQRVCGGDQ